MKLTDVAVRALSCAPGKTEQTFFDEALPGFGVRVRATGNLTWLVQYARAGRTKKVFLGSPRVVGAGPARSKAKDLLAAVRLGNDPAAEKSADRANAAHAVGALLPRFLARQRARLKPRSLQETVRHLEQHVRPLHAYPIEKVDRRQVAGLLSDIADASGPAAANRVRASLSAFFTWAAREGLAESNPVGFTNRQTEIGARTRVPTD